MSENEANITSDHNSKPDFLRDLERIIDVNIDDPFLYLQALRHRSALQNVEEDAAEESYERLEFLGDAVLELIVSRYLFKAYPEASEGFLTKLRSRLVRGDTLAKFARRLKLDEFIIMGERAREQNVHQSVSILADLFEALIGAMYLDQGFEATDDLVVEIIEQMAEFEDLVKTMENYKSLLLEYAQSQGWEYPVYQTIKEEGPGHDKTFTVVAEVDGEHKGRGVGKSKKKAEQAAARAALVELGVV